jgi:hypothetical protein
MNTVPPSFRHVRLVLAREKGAPQGDSRNGYDLLIPLDDENRLDPAEWKANRLACRVRRFQPGQADMIGVLRRKPGGSWFIDYADGDEDDEAGYRLGDERFVAGEYISIHDGDEMHTYRVMSVDRP